VLLCNAILFTIVPLTVSLAVPLCRTVVVAADLILAGSLTLCATRLHYLWHPGTSREAVINWQTLIVVSLQSLLIGREMSRWGCNLAACDFSMLVRSRVVLSLRLGPQQNNNLLLTGLAGP
jgi:hypothetical protein